MTKKKAVAKRKSGEVATTHNYGDHAGKGFQNQTQADIAMPFLNLLQAMSPEIDDVPGAKAGMIFNSVTQELYDELVFVPAITQHVFVEWTPREAGGGIVATHEANSPEVKAAKQAAATEGAKFGQYHIGGNDLKETFYIYGVILKDGVPESMAVLPMVSTKIGVYKKAMTRLNTFQVSMGDGRRISPPLFAHTLKLTTIKEKRPLGESYNFVVLPAVENDVEKSLLAPDSPAFLMGAECERLIDSGQARAATESVSSGADGADADDDIF